jgi:hypothetical protein
MKKIDFFMQVFKIYHHYTMSLFGITEELREAFSNSDGTVDDVGTEIFPDSIREVIGDRWDDIVADIFWGTSDYYLSIICDSIISATGFVSADVVHEYDGSTDQMWNIILTVLTNSSLYGIAGKKGIFRVF